MSIVFYNNWLTLEELRLLEVTFIGRNEDGNKCGFALSLIGFGVVILFNLPL